MKEATKRPHGAKLLNDEMTDEILCNVKWCTREKESCIYASSNELWTAIAMQKWDSGVIATNFTHS